MTNANTCSAYKCPEYKSPTHIFPHNPQITGAAPLWLDVRRAAAMQQNHMTIPGALLAPDLREIASFNLALRAIRPALQIICVHGHERSLAAQAMAREAGWSCAIYPGGFDAYCAAGGVILPIIDGVTGCIGTSRHWVLADDLPGRLAGLIVGQLLDPTATLHFIPEAHHSQTIEELRGHGWNIKCLFGLNAPFADLADLSRKLNLSAQLPSKQFANVGQDMNAIAALALYTLLHNGVMSVSGANI